MSVDLAAVIRLGGGDERTALAQYPGFLLVSLTAGQVRASNLEFAPLHNQTIPHMLTFLEKRPIR